MNSCCIISLHEGANRVSFCAQPPASTEVTGCLNSGCFYFAELESQVMSVHRDTAAHTPSRTPRAQKALLFEEPKLRSPEPAAATRPGSATCPRGCGQRGGHGTAEPGERPAHLRALTCGRSPAQGRVVSKHENLEVTKKQKPGKSTSKREIPRS